MAMLGRVFARSFKNSANLRSGAGAGAFNENAVNVGHLSDIGFEPMLLNQADQLIISLKVYAGKTKAAVLWKNISLFFALPAVVLCSAQILWQHSQEHHAERPDVLNYEYMRIRRTKFPWGDGNRTLFHNKHVNALPSGYEE